MKKFIGISVLLSSLLIFCCGTLQQSKFPLIDIKTIIPDIVIDLRYYGTHNFLGKPVNGYEKEIVYLSKEATIALQLAQNELKKEGYGFKVFDAYRPQRAVNHFKAWAKDINDTLAKNEFYPSVDKRDLFKLGYIAEKSGHSRGSTIDLTIINLSNKKELDMGTGFDFFGNQSHHDYDKLTQEQKSNRLKLKNIMEKYSFKAFADEWWHYTLKNEPFKDKYFDFPVK